MKSSLTFLLLVVAGTMAPRGQAAELPAEVAELVKVRDYSAAFAKAKGEVEGEALADIEALALAKSWVVKGVQGGRKRPVTIEMMGRKMRGKLSSADEKAYSVKVMGMDQKFKWSETSSERFYYIAKKYAKEGSGADHIALARVCIRLGLADQATSEIQAAISADFKLGDKARALRDRLSGAAPASPGGGETASRPASGTTTRRTTGRASKSVSGSESGRTVPTRSLPSVGDGGTDTVTVTSGAIRFTVSKDSGGFVDELWWGGTQIAKSGGPRRSFCDAFKPAAATDGRGNVGEYAKSKAVVTAIIGAGSSASVAGKYRSAAGEVSFVNRISASGDTLKVEQNVLINWSPNQWRLAGLGVTLPFALTGSKHAIITTVPGEKRTEHWKLDFNDDKQPNWLTSDSRSRWPLWRIGGLLVDSRHHYKTWKTNFPNTWPLVVDEGTSCKGILDLQDRSKGVTVAIAKMREEAPKEIEARGDPGAVTAWFWSPRVAPLDLRATGTGAKSRAEMLGIYPKSSKSHLATFTFHKGGKNPSSFGYGAR